MGDEEASQLQIRVKELQAENLALRSALRHIESHMKVCLPSVSRSLREASEALDGPSVKVRKES